MKEKKHIDELFKERFETYEPAPSPRVWESIEAQLSRDKRERKVVPLWWKVAGVAALLALLVTIGNSLLTSDSPDSEIVTTEPTESQRQNDGAVEEPRERVSKPAPIASEEVPKLTHDDDRDNGTSSVKSASIPSQTDNSSNGATQGIIASEEKNIKGKNLPTPQQATQGQQRDAGRFVDPIEKKQILNQREVIAVSPQDEKAGQADKNRSVEQKSAETIKESIPTETTAKPSLLEEVAKNEAESTLATTASPTDKWSVAPTVGPVYYSSLDNGSSIDPTFADNAQEGEVNFSYGVQVSYNINNRLSVRSGIANVALSYRTGGIEVGSGPVSAALKTVDYGSRNVVVTAFDKGTLSQNTMEGNPFENVTPKATGGNAQLVQNINYFEVPLELKYAVLDTKVGINVIGGMSTLLLGNNEIAIESNNFNTVLGEANNLNEVSFTTNVGLGVDYKITKNLLFNIEPIFKYQLNPYTDSSVNFRPYYFGVYSGLNFKF
ncbi:MAG: hypothetical protein CMC08_02635 [Flavobacteriaceae bacterium]|nr:hypothetical protein [Flavobacteriaceae bacterium]